MELKLNIPETKDVLTGDLGKRGNWIVASVSGPISWPVTSQKFSFRGVALYILPVTKGHFPGVAMDVPPGMKSEDAERLIMRFLSTLSWIERRGVVVQEFTGGNIPRPMGRRDEFELIIQEDFDLSYLPEPTNEKSLLALALMREGRGLNHPAYAFLSFYRVLEVALPDGRKRGEWIGTQIGKLTDHQAKEVITKLKSDKIDIGKHLQESRRQAIAHASREPIIDPDDPTETRILRYELPLIVALAEAAIESELGVETNHTVWQKHLYELEGFKKIFRKEILEKILKKETLPDDTAFEIPRMSVELRKRAPYLPLTNLYVEQLELNEAFVIVLLRSDDGLVTFRFILDFAEERLVFDIDNDLSAIDDGTAHAAEVLSETTRFMREYWLNGQLRILNAATGALLSRKDAFIPVNRWSNDEAFGTLIEDWQAKAAQRKAAEEKVAPENGQGAEKKEKT